jgi:hypothetical protein
MGSAWFIVSLWKEAGPQAGGKCTGRRSRYFADLVYTSQLLRYRAPDFLVRILRRIICGKNSAAAKIAGLVHTK